MAGEFMNEARQALQAQMEGIKRFQQIIMDPFRRIRGYAFRAAGVGAKAGKDAILNQRQAGKRRTDIEIPNTSLTKDEYEKLVEEDRLSTKRKNYAFSIVDKDGTLLSHNTDKKRFIQAQKALKDIEATQLHETDLLRTFNKNETSLITSRENFRDYIRRSSALPGKNVVQVMSENNINMYSIKSFMDNENESKDLKNLFYESGFIKMAEDELSSENARRDLYTLQRTAQLRNELRHSQRDPYKNFSVKRDTLVKINQYCKDGILVTSQLKGPISKNDMLKELTDITNTYNEQTKEFALLQKKYNGLANVQKNHPKYNAKLKIESNIKALANQIQFLENKKRIYEQLSVIPSEFITQKDVEDLSTQLKTNPIYEKFNEKDGKESDFSKRIHTLSEFEFDDSPYSESSIKELMKNAYFHETNEELRMLENEKYLARQTKWQDFYKKYNIGLPIERKEADAPSENDIVYEETEFDVLTGEKTQLNARYNDTVEGEKNFFNAVVTFQENKDAVSIAIDSMKNSKKIEDNKIETHNQIDGINNHITAERAIVRLQKEEAIRRETEGNYKKVCDKIQNNRGAWVALNVDSKNKDAICKNVEKLISIENDAFLPDKNTFFAGSLKNIETDGLKSNSDYTIIMPASAFMKMDEFSIKQFEAENPNAPRDRNYQLEGIVFTNKKPSLKSKESEVETLQSSEDIEDVTVVDAQVVKGREIHVAKELMNRYIKEGKECTIQLDVSPRREENSTTSHLSIIDENNLLYKESREIVKNDVGKDPDTIYEILDKGLSQEEEKLASKVTKKTIIDKEGNPKEVLSIEILNKDGTKDNNNYIAFVYDREGKLKTDKNGEPIKVEFSNGTFDFVINGNADENDLLFDDYSGEILQFELKERINPDGENEYISDKVVVVDMNLEKENTQEHETIDKTDAILLDTQKFEKALSKALEIDEVDR